MYCAIVGHMTSEKALFYYYFFPYFASSAFQEDFSTGSSVNLPLVTPQMALLCPVKRKMTLFSKY